MIFGVRIEKESTGNDQVQREKERKNRNSLIMLYKQTIERRVGDRVYE